MVSAVVQRRVVFAKDDGIVIFRKGMGFRKLVGVDDALAGALDTQNCGIALAHLYLLESFVLSILFPRAFLFGFKHATMVHVREFCWTHCTPQIRGVCE